MKGVVFDFGGVMTTCTMPDRVRSIVDSLGIPWKVLEDGFARYRRLMDGGFISMAEMYDVVAADAALTIPPEAMGKIIEADVASYLYPNLRTLEWMKELKSKGYKIGILTNMCREFAEKFRQYFTEFIAQADAIVISGEERMYKPQRRIYELLAERIGLKAEDLVFIDDVEGNCEGARAAGWQAIRFESNQQVEAIFNTLRI